ncbi:xanthine dehydrogenase/oxidase-like [Palaemon carinicauda]|uniref:xanthine dehydrogenase/oxidase-like n=1 Tax=Palaemon carinicauda TaxID=392227 RepID=UPI0035B58B13
MQVFDSPAEDTMSNTLVFFVNGRKVTEENVDPEWTLLTYLRKNLRLTGAKLGCGEGGCGACTVMLSRYDHERLITRHYSVNACLTPVASVHGLAVTTVEGIGSIKDGLHAVQDRLAKAHGSQCGFCTPGIVMSMYVLLRNKNLPSMDDIVQHLTGNLCRCTGYRAILDGFSSFTGDFSTRVCSAGVNCCRVKKGSRRPFQNVEARSHLTVYGTKENVENGKEVFIQNGCGNSMQNGSECIDQISHNKTILYSNRNVGEKWRHGNPLINHDDELKNAQNRDPNQSLIQNGGGTASQNGYEGYGCANQNGYDVVPNGRKKFNSEQRVTDQNGHGITDKKYGGNSHQNGHGMVQEGDGDIAQNGHENLVEKGYGYIKENRFKDVRSPYGENKSRLFTETNGNISNVSQKIIENSLKENVKMEGKSSNVISWTPYDPTQEIIFPPELKIMSKRLDRQMLEFQGKRVAYYRPVFFENLLDLKDRFPHAKIIVGNTEVGVEVAFKKQHYPILINPTRIPQFTASEVLESGVRVGAAVTLTELQGFLMQIVNSHPPHLTKNYSALLEMLKWFAGQQIRNTASIGGNIMTSSPVSDLNPIFVAAGVTLTFAKLGGKREVVMDEKFFTGYRTNTAQPNEVLTSIFIPHSKQDEFIRTYKQSRRRNDDIAIVNAAFKVEIHPETCVLSNMKLAFGGMAAKTLTTPRTMKELIGCKWDETLLEKGLDLLLEDLPLNASAPGGMVEYRRTLTLSFFFKFYLGVREWLTKRTPRLKTLLSPVDLSVDVGSDSHSGGYRGSSQRFSQGSGIKEDKYPVGQPFVHASAFKHTSGEAVYVDDMPHREDELHAALVVSSHANARILRIDETPVLKMEGVHAFFSAKDLPGDRNMMGCLLRDEEIFASQEAPCVGQVIGIVVADDQATARLAASKVSVLYESISSPIITIEDAISNKSWWGPWVILKGNLDEGFKQAEHILEGEMRMGGQEHFYMEPNAHIAVPKGEDGEMEIFTSSQVPTSTQMQVAKSLSVPANRIAVRIKRLGGAFGGKESRPLCISVPLALAASKLQRPVRITLDRQEDMLITAGRHPFLCRWKVGFTSEGRFTALQVNLYSNAGCAYDVSGPVMHKAMFSIDNAYMHENIQITGYVCKTHLPSNTAMRGFGAPQAAMFAEEIASQVATFLRTDPVLVRERNMYKSGNVTHINHTLEHCTIHRCWTQVIHQSKYNVRAMAVMEFNKENSYRKRGLSVTPAKCGVAFDRILNQAGALVQIYTDSSVLITHGGVEMGQGLHTKMIQVAANVLKVNPENIHISETATDKVPNTSPTAASISSDIYGMAIANACNELNRRLKPYVTLNAKGQWKDWIRAAYADRVSLSATGFYRIDEVTDYDFEKQSGQPFHYYTNGAAVTEVEIDCLTGDHTILRTDIVIDLGNSLNPAIDIGQVEGAFLQGAGLVTLEELRYSPEGSLLTRGPGAYKIPGFQDIPQEFHVSLLEGAPNPFAIYSSKAVGEPPLLLATSVFQAIKAAVGAARAEQNLSLVFRLDSPATAERIRMACRGHILEKLNKKMVSEATSTENPWSVTV